MLLLVNHWYLHMDQDFLVIIVEKSNFLTFLTFMGYLKGSEHLIGMYICRKKATVRRWGDVDDLLAW
jgi:hypothetical protein